MRARRIYTAACALVVSLVFMATATAQGTRVRTITSAQRLGLQQLDQLVGAEQTNAAVDRAIEMIDTADERLVPIEGAAADGFLQHVPLATYLNDRLLRWGVAQPDLLAAYRRRVDEPARVQLERAIEAGRVDRAFSVVERYLASSVGDQALRVAGDMCWDRGWAAAARSLYERVDPAFRAVAGGSALDDDAASAAWDHVLRRTAAEHYDDLADAAGDGMPIGSYVGTDLEAGPIAVRLVACSALLGEEARARREAVFFSRALADATVRLGGRSQSLDEALQAAASLENVAQHRGGADEAEWPMYGGAAARIATAAPLGDLPTFPSWTAPLEPFPAREDFADPEAPPTGEVRGRRAGRFPVVWGDRVFIHEGPRILGFDLRSGEPWPVPRRRVPIYDTGESVDEVFGAGDMPAAGWPRTTMAVAGDWLLTRTGPAVTGWLPAVEQEPRSASRLIALDLAREGQLAEGYPLRLAGSAWEGWEFEGAPLAVGDALLAGITARDATGIRSQLVCFDLTTGAVRWRSEDLAAAPPVAGLEANRVSHCLATYHQGAIYYHAHLGSVACLDPASGRVRWTTVYPRAELAEGGYPRRRRAAFRDLAPAVVHGEMVIVAPADCDRVFALDRGTGALLWATAPGEAADVVHMLGVADGHLIASGDALLWIRLADGRVRAAFPGLVSGHPAAGVPTPRAAGRGVIAGQRVVWPTADALWVFDARLAEEGPRLRRRIDLRPSGLSGGNLVAAGGTLVMTNDRAIAGFVSRPPSGEE